MIHKKERYKEVKWTRKKAVAEAKDRAFEAFHQKLDTKARSRQKKDLRTMKFITNKGGRVLLRQEDIKMR